MSILIDSGQAVGSFSGFPVAVFIALLCPVQGGPGISCAQWHHVCTSAQLVEVVGPNYHHLAAL